MLMPIGRFARACRLSVKSLRNYDESGLLSAAYVDAQSGYRYYRLEQLARADAIRSLRMVGMSLSQIAETLDGDEPDRVLMSHLAALNQERDEINRQAQELQRRINLKEFIMTRDITVKSNPAQIAAAWRTETTHSEIFDHIPLGFGKVMEALNRDDIDPSGAPFTIFHEAPDGDTAGNISMCVPIATAVSLGKSDDGVQVVELQADVTASVIHRGSYENMGESHAAVWTWIQKHGHRVVGSTREIYLNSPDDVAEADILTEILFPIDAEEAD
ncbi:MAG: MerR family transcriptional regulator [Actinobacteria bacterium]|nr:MerR family transcriptional regulator [Actinomycetota bacterium]